MFTLSETPVRSNIPNHAVSTETPTSLNDVKIEINDKLHSIEANFTDAISKLSSAFRTALQLQLKQSHVKMNSYILKACKVSSGKNSNDSVPSSNKTGTLKEKIAKQESEICNLKTRIETMTTSHESSIQCIKNKYELDIAMLESKLENTSQQFDECKLLKKN